MRFGEVTKGIGQAEQDPPWSHPFSSYNGGHPAGCSSQGWEDSLEPIP